MFQKVKFQLVKAFQLKEGQEFKFSDGSKWYRCIGRNDKYVIYSMIKFNNDGEYLGKEQYTISLYKMVYAVL
ncbi:hypothetical protein [Flavobacterium daejeonense]|uniref:hypothetical protein n=1 Tax=Flavobacterium daejeonense TaxID=350893 RepID=UPI0004797C72|nr:hypothetical protein [Flavobacterium daejeonense]